MNLLNLHHTSEDSPKETTNMDLLNLHHTTEDQPSEKRANTDMLYLDSQPPPPSYSESLLPPRAPLPNGTRSVSQSTSTQQQQLQQHIFHFPQSFGFYHASGSLSGLLLQQSKDDPHPTHYVSTHSGFSSQASVILHSGPTERSPPLATGDFHPFSSTTDIIVFPPAPQKPMSSSLEKDGMMSVEYRFRAPPVSSTRQLETYIWKNSSGNEIARLGGSSSGRKCVRASTGEVVAVWAHAGGVSYSKKGKFAFMIEEGKRRELGSLWEIMCVMSICVIMEKSRRQKQKQKQKRNGGTAGGMGFGAIGGGGGGC